LNPPVVSRNALRRKGRCIEEAVAGDRVRAVPSGKRGAHSFRSKVKMGFTDLDAVGGKSSEKTEGRRKMFREGSKKKKDVQNGGSPGTAHTDLLTANKKAIEIGVRGVFFC